MTTVPHEPVIYGTSPVAVSGHKLIGQAIFAGGLVALLAMIALFLGRPGGARGLILVSVLFPVAVLVLQSIIERMLPAAGPRKPLGEWLMHMQISLFFSVAQIVMTTLCFLGCSMAARTLGVQLGLFDIRIATGKGLLTLLASLWMSAIIADFFFYWFHRSLHENKFLWQHHKMHHSDVRLEAVSSARQNWLEAVFNSLCITAPMLILFKVDSMDQWQASLTAGLGAGLMTTFLTLSHMNIRLGAGWASLLWCSPQIHRIHHSREPKHFDKNYAFVFPFWDYLFGTYFHPSRNEYPETGVAGEVGCKSFSDAQIYTQREMLRYIRDHRRCATRPLEARPVHTAAVGDAGKL